MGGSSSGAGARIPIIDEGSGVPREKIPYIFECFDQGSTAEEFPGGRTGLGLAISKLLVEAYDGRITVENRGPEKGGSFRFTCPCPTRPYPLSPLRPGNIISRNVSRNGLCSGAGKHGA